MIPEVPYITQLIISIHRLVKSKVNACWLVCFWRYLSTKLVNLINSWKNPSPDFLLPSLSSLRILKQIYYIMTGWVVALDQEESEVSRRLCCLLSLSQVSQAPPLHHLKRSTTRSDQHQPLPYKLLKKSHHNYQLCDHTHSHHASYIWVRHTSASTNKRWTCLVRYINLDQISSAMLTQIKSAARVWIGLVT